MGTVLLYFYLRDTAALQNRVIERRLHYDRDCLPRHTRLILLAYNRALSCRGEDFGAVHCNIMIRSIFCNTFTEEGTNNILYLDPTTVSAFYCRVLALKSVKEGY
jgi:hypothetical protein